MTLPRLEPIDDQPKSASELRERYEAARARLNAPANAKPDPEAPYLWCNRAIPKGENEPTPEEKRKREAIARIRADEERRRKKQEKQKENRDANRFIWQFKARPITKELREMQFRQLLRASGLKPGEALKDLPYDGSRAIAPIDFAEQGPVHNFNPSAVPMSTEAVIEFIKDRADYLAYMYGLEKRHMLSRIKHPVLQRARYHLMYDARRGLDCSNSALAYVIGTADQSVSYWIISHCVINGIPLPKGIQGGREYAARALHQTMCMAAQYGRRAMVIDTFPFIKLINEPIQPGKFKKISKQAMTTRRPFLLTGLTKDEIDRAFYRIENEDVPLARGNPRKEKPGKKPGKRTSSTNLRDIGEAIRQQGLEDIVIQGFEPIIGMTGTSE